MPDEINGFTSRQVRRIRRESGCSDPGFLRLNLDMLARFHPEWCKSWLSKKLWFEPSIRAVREQLIYGDRSPAIVVSASPLLVAAYSEEIDGVAMLRFASAEVPAPLIIRGQRLVTINLDYSSPDCRLASDLTFGSDSPQRWYNFLPLIGDFLTNEQQQLTNLKASIPEDWWLRVDELADAYNTDLGFRDGRPGFAMQPVAGDKEWQFSERGH